MKNVGTVVVLSIRFTYLILNVVNSWLRFDLLKLRILGGITARSILTTVFPSLLQ